MAQTANYSFPLWGDTPPTGATGKTLRDALLGEGPDSLSNMVDAKLKELADTKEDASNKVRTYTGMDGSWSNSADDYPSVVAVRDFVQSYVSTFSITTERFDQIFNGLIKPLAETVQIDTVTWDGATSGKANVIGMFYKISDSTVFPDTFSIELSTINNATGAVSSVDEFGMSGISEVFLNDKTVDAKEPFGIVVYSLKQDTSSTPLVVVADRAGILPAAAIEQMLGVNPGTSVPYEAGVYVMYSNDESNSALFVSKATSCMSVKNYIDKKIEDLTSGAG